MVAGALSVFRCLWCSSLQPRLKPVCHFSVIFRKVPHCSRSVYFHCWSIEISRVSSSSWSQLGLSPGSCLSKPECNSRKLRFAGRCRWKQEARELPPQISEQWHHSCLPLETLCLGATRQPKVSPSIECLSDDGRSHHRQKVCSSPGEVASRSRGCQRELAFRTAAPVMASAGKYRPERRGEVNHKMRRYAPVVAAVSNCRCRSVS